MNQLVLISSATKIQHKGIHVRMTADQLARGLQGKCVGNGGERTQIQ
jgi:hypothetical protein